MCTFYFWNTWVLLVLDYNKLNVFWNVVELFIWNTLSFISYIILSCKHMYWFFFICGSHASCKTINYSILILDKRTRSGCSLGAWGWMFQSWVVYRAFFNMWGLWNFHSTSTRPSWLGFNCLGKAYVWNETRTILIDHQNVYVQNIKIAKIAYVQNLIIDKRHIFQLFPMAAKLALTLWKS